jgi:transposase
MSRQRYKLSEEQLKELKSYYQAGRKWRVRTRCQAVWLYEEGRPVPEVVVLTGCSRSSLGDWWRRYRQKEAAGLEEHRLGSSRTTTSGTA